MSVLFLNPALLGLLALGALPVVVHLLSRSRPPVFRFSNIEFIQRILKRTARIRRPKDRLLLALRTLALLALAAAFALPFLVSASAPLPGEKSTVIVMVDRSASMNAREGAGSRFDAACAEAIAWLDRTSPAAANLIWIDAEPDAAFPEPGPNIGYLTDQLKQAEPLPEAGALAAAFDLALRQLARTDGRRELVVISDFQATAWKDFTVALPSDVTVRAQRVAESYPPNLAVTHLVPQPAEPLVGQDATVLVRVRNFSAEPVRTRLTVDAGGSRNSQPLDLPPWGEAEAAFPLRPGTAGPMPLSAMIEPDAYPGDDARHTILPVRDSLRLTIDGEAGRGTLQQLASALSWLETSVTSPDLRFVTGWTGDNPGALRDEALAGTTVIVQPAAGCGLASIRELLGQQPEAADGPLAPDVPANGQAAVPAEDHPACQLFAGGDFGNPFAGTFRERIRLPAALAESRGARPIARFADGIPGIVEFPTAGASFLLWNLALDPAKSDWPTQGSFLPAVAEIFLRTRPAGAAAAGHADAGGRLAWTSEDPAHAGAVELIGPDGEPLEVAESSTAEGIRWQTVQPSTPGIHRWQISGQTIARAAVNFPTSESDLRPLETAPAIGGGPVATDSLARQAALAGGLPLWPWLAVAALAFLMGESLVHLRSPRRTTA